MKIVDRIALVLVIIGALNWGGVGLFSFDCVAFLFGGQTGAVSRIIYTLVGIAGLWCITLLFREDGTENTYASHPHPRKKDRPVGGLFAWVHVRSSDRKEYSRAAMGAATMMTDSSTVRPAARCRHSS